jgi:SAM-dependent methyltransferase
MKQNEAEAMAERYARRAGLADRYSPLQPDVWQTLQERQRVWIDWLQGLAPLAERQLTEVGCGAGGNLLELLQLGFMPRNLQGLELLPERFALARERLPQALALRLGDACDAPIPPNSQDLVLASTVFSSILDSAQQERLARSVWAWIKPGGALLWYDFTVNNPRNPDVRGVPLKRITTLFPTATIRHRRVTLAPPLARALCRIHPAMYPVANALPILRTHLAAWIEKKPLSYE